MVVLCDYMGRMEDLEQEFLMASVDFEEEFSGRADAEEMLQMLDIPESHDDVASIRLIENAACTRAPSFSAGIIRETRDSILKGLSSQGIRPVKIILEGLKDEVELRKVHGMGLSDSQWNTVIWGVRDKVVFQGIDIILPLCVDDEEGTLIDVLYPKYRGPYSKEFDRALE